MVGKPSFTYNIFARRIADAAPSAEVSIRLVWGEYRHMLSPACGVTESQAARSKDQEPTSAGRYTRAQPARSIPVKLATKGEYLIPWRNVDGETWKAGVGPGIVVAWPRGDEVRVEAERTPPSIGINPVSVQQCSYYKRAELHISANMTADDPRFIVAVALVTREVIAFESGIDWSRQASIIVRCDPGVDVKCLR